MSALCQHIRDLREDADLTQQELANLLHISQATYSRYFPLRKRRAGYSRLRPDRVGAFLQSQCRLLVGFDQRPDAAMEVTSRYCKEHTFLFAAPHLRRDVSAAVSEDQEERGNGQGELPRSGKRGWSGPCGAFSPLASRPNEVVVMR